MGQRRKGRRRVYAENAIDAVDEAAVLERDLYRHLFSSRRLLPPLDSKHAPYRRAWANVLLLLGFFAACYFPFTVAFQLPRENGVFALPSWVAVGLWVSDVLFWVDIGLMFRTTKQEEGVVLTVVTDNNILGRQYLHSTFVLDILAILPLEFIALAIAPAATRDRGVLACLCSLEAVCLRTNRIVHSHRVASYHSKGVLTLSRMRRLLFFWALFGLLAHWVACLMWLVEHESCCPGWIALARAD